MNSELRTRCISLRNAGYSMQRIADRVSRDTGASVGKDRVRMILNERTMTQSQAGRKGAAYIKAMGLDRIGETKTDCGART